MSPPDHEPAQPPPVWQYNTPPALIAFTFAFLVLCFVAFSILYLCKYCLVSLIHSSGVSSSSRGGGGGGGVSSLVHGLSSPNNRSCSDPPAGLDPSLLQMFPTFVYSSVKDLRLENKYGLECAVCLLEFEDDSMLRHLTACCHVFHQECIDLWLLSHKTCPVCRTPLDPSPIKSAGGVEDNSTVVVVVDIPIEGCGGESSGDQRHEHDEEDQDEVGVSVAQQQQEQMFARSRSHSTGHSVVLIRGGDEGDEVKEEEEEEHDRYTLRLPEHVIRGHHSCSKSLGKLPAVVVSDD